MTVYDFCLLCIDDSTEIAIWDMGLEVEVFRGSMRDAMIGLFADCEVMSFDPPVDGVMCINIDTSEE